MAAADIGCSLAEAAEAPAYAEYLAAAATSADPGLHVVYINTSLRTKALAHAQVPTITCTSSNVVQTVLQVGSFACLACLQCDCGTPPACLLAQQFSSWVPLHVSHVCYVTVEPNQRVFLRSIHRAETSEGV